MNMSEINRVAMLAGVVAFGQIAGADYVSDGLVLHYDAINNTGTGTHDSSATNWKELSGKGLDFVLPSGAIWGDDSISFPKVSQTREVLGDDFTDMTQTNFTFEFVVRLDPTDVLDKNPYSGDIDVIRSKRCSLWFRKPGVRNGSSYPAYAAVGSHRYTGSGAAKYWEEFSSYYGDLHTLDFLRHYHTYAIHEVMRTSSCTFYWAVDGSVYRGAGNRLSENGKEYADKNLRLGVASRKIQIRAIRVYNRALTEAEVAQNAAEDALRWPAEADAEKPADPFADARWCFRGAKGETGANASYLNVVNGLYAGGAPGGADNGATPADRNVGRYGAATNCVITTMDVKCPYSGKTLKNRKVLDFRQCVWENASGVKRCNPCQLNTSVGGCYTNMHPTTVVARFRIGEYDTTEHTNSFNFLTLGYAWTAESGTWIKFFETNGDDNFCMWAYHGSNADKFEDMLTKSDYRISKGKWIDLALTVNGRVNELYYQVEGGKFYSGSRDANIVKYKNNRSSTLKIGGEASSSYSEMNAASVAQFRGQIQQLAVWDRQLSLDEVKACFRDGCDDEDDAVRIGVANGNRAEFAGTATTVDAADQDAWLSMTNALDKTGDSLTVNFDMPSAHILLARTFRFSAAPGTPAGAAIEVKLNGLLLDDELAVAADKTVSVAIPPAIFKATGNVLAVKRVDSQSGAIAIDAVTVTAGGDEEGAAPVSEQYRYDIYSDAYCWYKGFEDWNGDGMFFPDENVSTPQTCDCRDALRITDRASDFHKWKMVSTVKGRHFLHEKVSVTIPATGKTLTDEPCLKIVSEVNGTAEMPTARYGGINRNIFAVTNTTGYAVLARIRLDSYMHSASNKMAGVMGTGYDWGNKRGSCLGLYGEPDNMAVRIPCGYSELKFTGTQKGEEKNRLAQGKWIDICYSVSNSWFRLYTCVEGGDIVEQCMNGGSGASGSPASYSTLHIGTTNGGGENWGTSAGAFVGFNGYFHQVAVWPRTLSAKEVALAMKWPAPDPFHIGTVNGSAQEFLGADQPFTVLTNGEFRTASTCVVSGGVYEVRFECDETQLANQRLVVATTADSCDAQFLVELNGEQIVNFAKVDRSKIKFLTVMSGTHSEFGIAANKLKSGANILKLTRVDENSAPVVIDAVSLGNMGEKVRIYNAGAMLLIK